MMMRSAFCTVDRESWSGSITLLPFIHVIVYSDVRMLYVVVSRIIV